MDVEWVAVVPAAGRADRAPKRSDETTFRQQLDMLLGYEAGYLEVSKAGSPYPLLTLSTSEELAVVHRFDDEGACLLLHGEGGADPEDSHDFLVEDELAVFTGEFISSAGRAAEVLCAFAHGSDLDSLGRWERL